MTDQQTQIVRQIAQLADQYAPPIQRLAFIDALIRKLHVLRMLKVYMFTEPENFLAVEAVALSLDTVEFFAKSHAGLTLPAYWLEIFDRLAESHRAEIRRKASATLFNKLQTAPRFTNGIRIRKKTP